MTRLSILAVVAALLATACDEKKTSTDSPRPDASAGADKYASADPKLTQALQAAASSSAAASNGPPPAGIFGAGDADRRHAKGAPTTIDLVDSGGSPQITLASDADADASADASLATQFGPAILEVAMQLGPRVGIGIDFQLALGPAKKEDGPGWFVATVKRAEPSKEQGQAAAGAEKDIQSMAGGEIHIHVGNGGRESDVQIQPAKGSRSDLDRLLQTAAEALVFDVVPLPAKPVGVGAQWISETRMPLSGLDVIAYRAYRIKSIDGNRVHLTLDVKAYAANKDVQLTGVPKGATLQEFDAQSQGELELVRGEVMARKSDVQQRVVMMFAPPGGPQAPQQPGQPPGNMMTAQLQSEAKLLRGDDLRSAMKQ